MSDIFLTLLIVLFALDAASTVYILKRGGRELNRPIAWLMNRIGVQEALLFVKGAAFVVIAYFTPGLTPTACATIVAIYVVVLLWNFTKVYNIKKRRAWESK